MLAALVQHLCTTPRPLRFLAETAAASLLGSVAAVGVSHLLLEATEPVVGPTVAAGIFLVSFCTTSWAVMGGVSAGAERLWQSLDGLG